LLEFVEIGFTQKPKGVDGWLKINIKNQYLPDLKKARALFIDLNGSKVPFLIEKLSLDGQQKIKLDEINNPQEASLLCNMTAFMDKKEVSYVVEAEKDLLPIVGFKVLDQDDNERGIIETLKSYPNQVLAEIKNEKATFLLPIHENIIIDINPDSKVIKLEIVEGIEDLT